MPSIPISHMPVTLSIIIPVYNVEAYLLSHLRKKKQDLSIDGCIVTIAAFAI